MIDQLNRGGAERLLADLLPRLPAHDVEPTLCVLGQETRMVADFRQAGIEPVIMASSKWDPRVAGRLVRLMRERKVDLVNAHLGKSIVLGWLAARRAGLPFVAHDHVGPMWPHFAGRLSYRLENALMCRSTEWCMRRADAVIAVSEPGRQWLVHRHPALADKVTVIPNGIDLEALAATRAQRERHRREVRAEFGLPPDCSLILCAASFRPVKRWDVFLQVARQLCVEREDVYFIGAGDGSLRPDMQAWIDQAGLATKVHLPGVRDDVPRLMAAADIFLMPSQMESDGIVAKEAMAVGTPVVASDIPAIAANVEAEVCGILKPPGDVQGLAACCLRLLDSADMRDDMATAASQHADSRFSMDACTTATTDCFRGALASRGVT